jgi:AAA+ ATPase superfamily predicted ATPase
METQFIYNKFVTGQFFISRERELELFAKMVKQREHVLIYEPPKSGKQSLVQQAFTNLKKEGHHFTVIEINLFNVRTKRHLLHKICNSVLDRIGNTNEEKEKIKAEFCPGINKHLGNMNFQAEPETDIRPIPDKIIRQVLDLPQKISEKLNIQLIIYLQEFQELLLQDNYHSTLKTIEDSWNSQTLPTYIITGSLVNAMKEIFEKHKFFYNFAHRIKLDPLDLRSLSKYIISNFHRTGRVVSKELSAQMYNLTQGHPWYSQQLGDISYGLTRGFLSQQVLDQSFQSLLELHSYRYQLITSRLSRFQINFLKAVMDGVTQFSAAEVINYYGFNSSANVKRLKDAVQRKEILTKENGTWVFLDPLFETWLKTVYFQM